MFIHLHCHSHYSFLRAVPSPQEIVAAAAEKKMPAVALTDTGGLYAAVPFYQAARAAGVKPIIGTVLDFVAPPFRAASSSASSPEEDAALKGGATSDALLLLAVNHEGYSNLCRLVTRRHLDEAPVSLATLSEHRDGLIALYAPGQARDRRGAASSAPTDETTIVRLKDIFGAALYLEAWHFTVGQTFLSVPTDHRQQTFQARKKPKPTLRKTARRFTELAPNSELGQTRMSVPRSYFFAAVSTALV